MNEPYRTFLMFALPSGFRSHHQIQADCIPGSAEPLKVHAATLQLTLTPAMLKENALLAGLSNSMIAEVLEVGKLIDLTTPQQIYEGGREIREVYFPIDAVLSVVTQMRDGGSIEV